MEDIYEMETSSAYDALFDRRGVINPLCDNCLNPHCPYTIELKTLSVKGISEKHRLLHNYGGDYAIVLSCSGHLSRTRQKEIEEIEEIIERQDRS
jgi:hypothetical protein